MWKLVEVRFYNEWFQLRELEKWNWITFDVIRIQFDYDRFGPLLSFDFALAGLGFYISFNPPWETKQSRKIQQQIKEVREHPERLKPLEDWEGGQ